ncbi:hypothetical protein PYCCODRAFT_1428979 [Trametes coccinea BRFM310]|uniref:Uncharacterized protein n=1 Tax=Trametes coccinea (strain BRFM310) TaxID=1353009 RepID=A0A1Y2I9Q8_TRAC3|nr:hypothetical protein PYCCODRAFT_1428978 [Trametes coccinea BRFM310]OSC96651.1 hypothetical protein PYCCODRAFT_1428979 [Trametes coccinea BRFM310]
MILYEALGQAVINELLQDTARQKRLQSLYKRAPWPDSSNEDDAMDGELSVTHEWGPSYYARRLYGNLLDKDEEMRDESVPDVRTTPVAEATPRTDVEELPQVAARSEVEEIHQARGGDIVTAATMADAASTAASASAATATSESDTNTPTPASPVKPTPATAQVTASPCPEPMYRPVKASSVLPLDYLASSQTWMDSGQIHRRR